MNAILIDTTATSLKLAICFEGGTDYIRVEGLRHSLTLLSALDELLNRHGLTVADLDAVGVVVGPGSFTGIRIGVATAKAFSYALGIPLFGVNALRVLALNADCEDIVVAISDASNGYAYLAVYEKDTELLAPQCLRLAELEVFLSDLDKERVVGFPFADIDNKHGLTLALTKAVEGKCFSHLNDLEPLYIRKPQAEEAILKK